MKSIARNLTVITMICGLSACAVDSEEELVPQENVEVAPQAAIWSPAGDTKVMFARGDVDGNGYLGWQDYMAVYAEVNCADNDYSWCDWYLENYPVGCGDVADFDDNGRITAADYEGIADNFGASPELEFDGNWSDSMWCGDNTAGCQSDADCTGAGYGCHIQATWSGGQYGECKREFLRGDVNFDGQVTVADIGLIGGYLFHGNPSHLKCHDAADMNDDGQLSIADVGLVGGYLFAGTHDMPAPNNTTGPGGDPTHDSLGCTGE